MEELLGRARPSMTAFAVYLCKDRSVAADLVQETWFRAWNNCESYGQDTNFKAWIFTIMRNQFYNAIRKKKYAQGYVDHRMVVNPFGIVASNQDAAAELAQVLELMAFLEPEHREVLQLIVFDGMTYEQASEALNVPVGTMKSRLHRARANLRAEACAEAESHTTKKHPGVARKTPYRASWPFSS
jgi:RNA polymerase sigma-70 factor (ECF subfamily)